MIFVKKIPLPGSVRGLTVTDPDGDYTIFINEGLNEEAEERTLRHELQHIYLGHLSGDKTASACEEELKEYGFFSENIQQFK